MAFERSQMPVLLPEKGVARWYEAPAALMRWDRGGLQETQVYQALNDSAVGSLRCYAGKQAVIRIGVKEVPIWRGDLQRPWLWGSGPLCPRFCADQDL